LQEISLQGLHAALQHRYISEDEETVCSLLQTCKTWRSAVQQCAAGNLHIYIGSNYANQHLRSMQKLALFCSWLKQHAGLVGSIAFTGVSMSEASTEAGAAYCDAAEQLLALSLQEAAAVPAAPTGVAQMRTALQLQGCSIHCVRSSALLLALPASLQHLHLQHSKAWRSGLCFDSSSVTAALARLSQLRSLALVGEVGSACLAAVGQLGHLTELGISNMHVRADAGAAGRCDMHLLPQQLQSLEVTVSSDGVSPAAVALGHVTALKSLDLTLQCSAAPGSSLPSSLTALAMSLEEQAATAGSAQYLGMTALQQLQRLEAIGLQEPQVLEQLSTLAALTYMELGFVDAASSQRAAPVWQHLSMLRSLSIDSDINDPAQLDITQGAVLLQGLAAATSLTRLYIGGPIVHEGLQLCARLTDLSQLQMLEINNAGVASRSDALHLAALTSLTQLNLWGAVGVDDVAASVLALRLTRLQDLRLVYCGLRSAAALPSIATLTGLTRLDLSVDLDREAEGSDDDTESAGTPSLLPLGQEDLLLLTPLTQLRYLGCSALFSSTAIHQLWGYEKGWLQQPPAWLS
jgi:hypothetical protein